MPYLGGSTGHANCYDIGICVYWYAGHMFAVSRQISLTSLEKVLWGAAWGGVSRVNYLVRFGDNYDGRLSD